MKQLGWLVCGIALFAGCDGGVTRPPVISADAAQNAEPEVLQVAADQLLKLDAKELNDLFCKKHEANWSMPPGRICEFTGRVKEIIFREKDKENPNEYLRLALWTPDYAAVSVECYFGMKHKVAVQALKAGEVVTVRGKLSNPAHWVRENVVDLQGCVLVEE
jgi:hypothetical protein